MNLIVCVLIVVLNVLLNVQLTTGAYKKRRNEQCSLFVNGFCYDDELNDKPLKIVHDENGMKSVVGSNNSRKTKKSKKKVSTDVLQSKSWEQKFPKFKELFGNAAAKPKYDQPVKSNGTQIPNQQRQDQQRPQLIFKYHKLNDTPNRMQPNQVFTNQLPRSILDTSTIMPASSYGPLLPLPTMRPTTGYPHLGAFKTINRPMLASGSFQRHSYPLVSPFLNSWPLRLDHYPGTSLLTDDESPAARRKTARLVSNYQLKRLPSSKPSTPVAFKQHKATTSSTSSSNYWLPNFFTTPSAIVPALPTNLTNYINLRESGRLFNDSFAASDTHNNYNTTQDRVWTDDDSNEVMPTKASPFDEFDKANNKTKSDLFQFVGLESDDVRSKDLLTTTDLSSNSQDSPFSTEESSKESVNSAFQLASNQLEANSFGNLENGNEFEKDRNRQTAFLDKDAADKFSSLDSREFVNEKFESAPPLSDQPHDWATPIDTHHIDDLLPNGKPKPPNDLKTTINYLTDDEQKANLLSNNHAGLLHENYPVFYPVKHHNKPTYTIIQLKDNKFQNLDKWKQTMKTSAKLLKKVAIEEAKKLKKNSVSELDTFLKRKKLIIDRYKPNDYYQKALAAKYVWKKVSLDFLSLLGYQIANYLGPLNAKHWIKHSDLIDRNPDQLKALEHILKSQQYYYPANDPNLGKYLLAGGHLAGEHDGLVGDEFHSVHGGLGHFSSSTAEQFLNDDTFFNQNYFKLKENDESAAYMGSQNENKLVTSEDPLMASSLTNEVNPSNHLKTTFDQTKGPFDQAIKAPFPTAISADKEKELDKQFYTNQLLNQKLLHQQLNNDNTIDFRTKEQLQQMIKPIKIQPTD